MCLLWRNVCLGLVPFFLNWVFFFFWFRAVWAAYISWSLIICNYFLPFWGLSFNLVFYFLCYRKLWNSIRSHLLSFISITLGGGLKRILLCFTLCFMSRKNMRMFSSKCFIVSNLTFRSLIHFKFIFVYGVRKCSNTITIQPSHYWAYTRREPQF